MNGPTFSRVRNNQETVMIRSIWILLLITLTNHVNGQYQSTILPHNSTLGIIIDKSYLADNFENIEQQINEYVTFAKREISKSIGVSVIFFTWVTLSFKQDFTAILSITSCENTWDLFRVLSSDNILLLAITEKNCPRLPKKDAVLVSYVDRGYELPQIVFDLRQNSAYKWKSAFVFYDDSLSNDVIDNFMKSFTYSGSRIPNDGISLMMFKLNDTSLRNSNAKAYIESFYNSIGITNLRRNSEQNFIIAIREPYVRYFMEVSKKMQLVHPTSQWLYFISDTEFGNDNIDSLLKIVSEGDNVSFLANVTTGLQAECKTGVICHATELIEAFFVATEIVESSEIDLAKQLSDEEFESLKLSKVDRKEFTLKEMQKKLQTTGSCDNCMRWNARAAETWGLINGDNLQKNKRQRSTWIDVGFWRLSDGFNSYDALFPHIAHGFRKINLLLVSFNNPPWQILTFNQTGHVTGYDGIVFRVIDELSRVLNFSFTVSVPDDGRNRSDSIQNTILTAIAQGKSLFSACSFSVDEQLVNSNVSFTIPISIQSYGFLVSHRRELSRIFLFVSPFSGTTWFCLIMTVLMISPVLYAIDRFSPVYEYNFSAIRNTYQNLQTSLWYVFGALLQQSGSRTPHADSSRIIVGLWWVVVVILVTAYCGNLVAFLTFPKIEEPIFTTNDVIRSRHYLNWGFQRNTFFHETIKGSKSKNLKTIYENAILHDQLTDEILEKVRARTHVYFDSLMNLNFLMKDEFLKSGVCDFALSKEEVISEKIVLIVPKSTPYLTRLNLEISRLQKMGLIQKWVNDFLPKRDKCWKSETITSVTNHQVNLKDMQGNFFILIIGCCIAITSLIIEKLLRRQQLKKERLLIKPFVN